MNDDPRYKTAQTNFEDFEKEEKSGLFGSETDEIRATGFAKEAIIRKGREWTESKMLEHHPEYVTIIPKLIRYDKATKWVESQGITTKETSGLTKALLYGFLVFCLLLLVVFYLINSRKNLMNPLTRLSQQQSRPMNIESDNLKKTKKNTENKSETLKSKTVVEDEKQKKQIKNTKKEPSLYESIMEEVE